MALLVRTSPFDSAKASFRTHLNYVKCIEKLLSSSNLSVQKNGTPTKRNNEVKRFQKLYNVTLKSIKKDVELAKEDAEFAVIIAPWFPVKCYYAIYYLESVLLHLIDGCAYGFSKGGHTGVRKKIYSLINSNILFNHSDLDTVYNLTQVQSMPSIDSGRNARNDYWQKQECIQSVAKILMRYKLHDAKTGRKWNLRTKKHRAEKQQFISTEQLALIDFFYWYRIKANYRDLDYIDFENGITANEVLEYVETYYRAFDTYRAGLVKQINSLL